MSSNSIPVPLRDLLAKLEYLAMIERDKKPCMHDLTFVDANSLAGAYKRSLAGEGRRDMMIQINTIVDMAIEAIREYRETEFLSLIINKLARAKTGIGNLTTTYQDSPDIATKIIVCIDNINIQLEKNKALLQGHQPISVVSRTVGIEDPRGRDWAQSRPDEKAKPVNIEIPPGKDGSDPAGSKTPEAGIGSRANSERSKSSKSGT